jgi:uncharacterized protein (DUF2147 family)
MKAAQTGQYLRRFSLRASLAAALGVAILSGAWPAGAQGVKSAPGDSPAASAKAGINVLKGNWVRPDGDYTIAIKSIGADGQLEAMYFNPTPLPFAQAQAVQKGTALRVSLELRAGGYSGSTYELTYDSATDRLTGIYYQAVAKQRYEIYFVRKRA